MGACTYNASGNYYGAASDKTLSVSSLTLSLSAFFSRANRLHLVEIFMGDRAGVFPNVSSLTWTGQSATTNFTYITENTWAAGDVSFKHFFYYIPMPEIGTGALAEGKVSAVIDSANVDFWSVVGWSFYQARQAAPTIWGYTTHGGANASTFAHALTPLIDSGGLVMMSLRECNGPEDAGGGDITTCNLTTIGQGGGYSNTIGGAVGTGALRWIITSGRFVTGIGTNTALNVAFTVSGTTAGYFYDYVNTILLQSEDNQDDIPITFYSRTLA